jgi:hypothetical protein
MQQPDLKEIFKSVLTAAEEQKKAADLLFAHQKYEEAAETYTKACKGLGSIWGFPFGMVVSCIYHCFMTQARHRRRRGCGHPQHGESSPMLPKA